MPKQVFFTINLPPQSMSRTTKSFILINCHCVASNIYRHLLIRSFNHLFIHSSINSFIRKVSSPVISSIIFASAKYVHAPTSVRVPNVASKRRKGEGVRAGAGAGVIGIGHERLDNTTRSVERVSRRVRVPLSAPFPPSLPPIPLSSFPPSLPPTTL